MAPITPADLSSEIQEILDKPTTEGACVSDQPACTPDSRVTAQLSADSPTRVVLPWRISNANKGHLIMIPGGSAGLIGGLLSQIDPPQYFSHMGIMTKDQTEFRHATAMDERLKQFPHYAGTEGDPGVSLKFVPGIGDAPTDGFQEEPLRYGWPGTITQTVEKAYLTWLNHPTVKDDDGDDIPDPAFSEDDPKSGRRYFVDAMTLGPARLTVRGQPTTVWPLVVQPCPTLETDAVRGAVERIADSAIDLRGHYRFYGYTKAEVGLDENEFGSRVLETMEPDPLSPCIGTRRQIDVIRTVPMVCSTFIWLAVQAANKKSGPKIVLDGRPQRHPATDIEACHSFFAREMQIDKIDAQTLDGLYFYGKDERVIAGNWLYNYIHQQVLDTIAEDTDLNKQLDKLFSGSSTLWDFWGLFKLLVTFSLPTVALITALSSEILDGLIKLMTDMPDDVASQICNAFANDQCDYTAKDSDAWKTPGEGHTVSPDNIINSWALPTSEDNETIHGVYGYNWKTIIRPPELVRDPPPPSTWQISQGFGSMEGRVTFQGVGVQGAEVRVGCTKFRSGHDGGFMRRNLASGKYWATARYVHPTSGLLLEAKGRAVEIRVDAGIGQKFELDEPPDTRRQIWVEGHMDLVNRYAVGKDWWDHPLINMKPAFLGLDYFPDEPEFAAQRASSLKQTRDEQHQVDDWGQAQVKCDLEIQPDKSIKVTASARLKEIEDDDWQAVEVFSVPPKAANTDPGVGHVMDVVRSEMAWPVRAHIELVVHNYRAE